MFWSQHLGCWGQNTSRIQNKVVYATLCLQAIELFWKFVVKGAFTRPKVDWRVVNLNIGFAWDTSFLGQYANDPTKTWDQLTTAQRIFRVVNVGFKVKARNLLSQKHTRCETFCDGMFDPDWKYYPAKAVYSPARLRALGGKGKTDPQPGVKSRLKLAHQVGDYHDLMRKCVKWMDEIRAIGQAQDLNMLKTVKPVPRLFVFAPPQRFHFEIMMHGTVSIPLSSSMKGLCTNTSPKFPISVQMWVPWYIGDAPRRTLLIDETIGRDRDPKEWDSHAYSQCGMDHFNDGYNRFRFQIYNKVDVRQTLQLKNGFVHPRRDCQQSARKQRRVRQSPGSQPPTQTHGFHPAWRQPQPQPSTQEVGAEGAEGTRGRREGGDYDYGDDADEYTPLLPTVPGVSDDDDDFVPSNQRQSSSCQFGSMWMLVLDELVQLGLPSHRLKQVIASLETEAWAAPFFDMQETKWVAGKYERFENPFERPEYKEFYDWFVRVKEDYPGQAVDRQQGGIRIKFPDMSLWSLICLGSSAITGQFIDPGFDTGPGRPGLAECSAYLTDLFGGAPVTKLEIGLKDIFVYYPFKGSKSNGAAAGPKADGDDDGTVTNPMHAAEDGALEFTGDQQADAEVLANSKPESFFVGTEFQMTIMLTQFMALPVRLRVSGSAGKDTGTGTGGGTGGRGRRAMDSAVGATVDIGDLAQQINAIWSSRPSFIDVILDLLDALFTPPTSAVLVFASAEMDPAQLPRNPQVQSMPAGMTMPAGVSLSFKLGRGFFANLGSEYPAMKPLMDLVSFLDSLEFTVALNPVAVSAGVSLKFTNLAPKDASSCNMVCHLLHLIPGLDKAELYAYAALMLVPYREFQFGGGIKNLNLQIPGIDWFALKELRYEATHSQNPKAFGNSFMIYGSFDLPNFGNFGSTARDITPVGNHSFRFPDGSVKSKAVVARLTDTKLRFTGGIGFVQESKKIGPKFAFSMSGYYMNVFTSSYFHFGNLNFNMVLTANPPFLGSAEVGGDFCLGTFGRCGLCLLDGQNSTSCGPDRRIMRLLVYAGIGINVEDNYLLAKVSGTISIKSLIEVFDLDSQFAVPDVVGNAVVLEPRTGQTGITLSYSMQEEKEIVGMYNPVTGTRGKIIVPLGLQVDGRVTVFKGIKGLQFQADIQIVFAEGSLLINYTQSPINFGNVFKVTSYDDDSVGPSMYVLAKWPAYSTMFMAAASSASGIMANPSAEQLAKEVLKQFGLVVKISGKVSIFGMTRRILVDIGKERALFRTDGTLFSIMHAEFEVDVGYKAFPPSFRARGKFSLPSHQMLIQAVRDALGSARDAAVSSIAAAQSDVDDAQASFNGEVDSLQAKVAGANKAFDAAVSALGTAKGDLDATRVRVDKDIDALIQAVRGANAGWDTAVAGMGDASAWLRDQKLIFDDAQAHLRGVHDDVDAMCNSGRKCGWNPICHAKNGACKLVKLGAKGLISLAMIAMELPKLAVDAAAAVVDAAAVLVDKSRVILKAAEYALEAGRTAAQAAIGGAKALVSLASIAVDNSRWTLDVARGALEVGRGLGNGAFETANLALEGAKGVVKMGLYIAEKLAEYALSAFYIEVLEFDVQLTPDQQTLQVKFKGVIFGQAVGFDFTLDFAASQSHILTLRPLFSKMARNLDLSCVFVPAPCVLGPKHVSNPE